MITFTDTMRTAIIRATAERTPRFAEFPDGAYAVEVGNRDGLYLLVYPAPDGAPKARETYAWFIRPQAQDSHSIAAILYDYSESTGDEGEGILLVLAPRGDRCAPLATFSPEVQERLLADLRGRNARFGGIAVADVWVNTTFPDRLSPFIVRVDRIADPLI